MGIKNTQKSQHCGTKPKKIAFGIAPLGIISIGIVPMGVISIGVVPMGLFSFGAVAMGIVNLSVVGMGIISAGITTMGVWEYSPNSQSHNHHSSSKNILYKNNEKIIQLLPETDRKDERVIKNIYTSRHIDAKAKMYPVQNELNILQFKNLKY